MSDSPWPWHFTTLSEDDKLRRRELLDIRGSYAQWSVVIVISLLRVYQAWVKANSTNDSPSSRTRRGLISWWDRPVVTGWIESRKHYLVCGLWLLWLMGLSIWKSGEDYLHFTKALGHVALSQVPLQILMSPAAYISTSRPSASSIFSYLTSTPQATVTPYHRLFGRIVITPLLSGHAILYLLFFIQSEHPEYGTLLSKRIRDFDVQCGLLAISTAILLLLFARPRASQARPVAGLMQERRRSFYYGHLFLVVVLCVSAYAHVAQAQNFMLQALGASLLNGACSFAMVRCSGRK